MKKLSKIKSLAFACLAIVVGLCVATALIEIGVRIYIRSTSPELTTQIIQHQDALSRKRRGGELFQPHPYLSFESTHVRLTQDGCIISDKEYSFDKPEGVLRIACIGGSTTMQAYPTKIDFLLDPYYEQPIEVMDWGCSGWTIVESTINFLLRVRAFHPDVVIIHHGMNDVAPRERNTFQIDYTHYRKIMEQPAGHFLDNWFRWSWAYAWMQVRAGGFQTDLINLTVKKSQSNEFFSETPPPDFTLMTFKTQLDALVKLAKEDNTKVVLAGMIYHETPAFPKEQFAVVDQHNQLMKQAADDFGGVYVDLASVMNSQSDLFVDNCHLTGIGDFIKAKYIAEGVNQVMGLPESTWKIDISGYVNPD